MNKIISLISQTVLGVSLLTAPLYAASAPAAFPPFNDPEFQKQLDAQMKEFEKLSPAEQEALLQQEMSKLMEDEEFQKTLKKIEDFSQTPEGKELFNKIEKNGDISDEDLNQLMNFVETPQTVVPTPEPIKMEIPKAEPKPVITSADQKAIAMVTDLISNTATFIVKAGQITDIANKVKRWEKKYPSFKWKKNNPWNTFTADLDKFVSQLKMLLQKDPKDQSYLHIKALIADKSLYNNLSKTSQAMAKLEPSIEDITPSVKLSARSKKSVIAALSECNEVLYILNAPKDIDAVLQKFEPTAKKLTETEAAFTKKADDASKNPRARGRVTTAGQSEDNSYYAPIPYDNYSNNSYSQPYTPSYSSSYEPYDYGNVGDTSVAPSSSTKKSSGGGAGAPSAKAADKYAKEDTKDATKAPDKNAVSPELQKFAETAGKQAKKISESAGSIIEDIEASSKALTGSNTLANLKAHLTDESPVDADLIKIATDVKDSLSSNVRGTIDTITAKAKKLNAQEKKAFEDTLTKTYKKYPIFDKVISDYDNDYEALKPTIKSDKHLAYYGVATQPSAQDTARMQAQAEEIKIAQDAGTPLTPEQQQNLQELTANMMQAMNPNKAAPIKDLVDTLKKFKDAIKVTKPKQAPAA